MTKVKDISFITSSRPSRIKIHLIFWSAMELSLKKEVFDSFWSTWTVGAWRLWSRCLTSCARRTLSRESQSSSYPESFAKYWMASIICTPSCSSFTEMSSPTTSWSAHNSEKRNWATLELASSSHPSKTRTSSSRTHINSSTTHHVLLTTTKASTTQPVHTLVLFATCHQNVLTARIIPSHLISGHWA